ncbi:hypothetical protein LCGC14_1277000 [marine sediment metagenome]|uniref:Uncharacterized protein n=1 Tax=marine sediment metagenome TaxID=412755 RepID=A0A0F9KWA9_9ZZZZ
MDIFLGVGETVVVNTHLGLIKIECSEEGCEGQKQAPKAIAVKITPSKDTRVQEMQHDDYTFLVRGDPTHALDRWMPKLETKSG